LPGHRWRRWLLGHWLLLLLLLLLLLWQGQQPLHWH
jgi:hypothetical protein